jgi:hypothetical protein
MTAKQLRGVYNYNPTTMVMKQGSQAARLETSSTRSRTRMGQRSMRAGDSSADNKLVAGTEASVHHPANPCMATRGSSDTTCRYADGRRHENEHYAVKQLKG